MAYIDRSDCLKVIGKAQLEQLEKDEPDLIQDLSDVGEVYISNYISDMYDLATEFAKVGNDRDSMLKQIAIAIVAYYAFQRVASDQIPDIRVKAYDDAIQSLEKSQKGQLYFKGIGRNEPNGGRTMIFGEEENPTFNKNIY